MSRATASDWLIIWSDGYFGLTKRNVMSGCELSREWACRYCSSTVLEPNAHKNPAASKHRTTLTIQERPIVHSDKSTSTTASAHIPNKSKHVAHQGKFNVVTR